MIIKLISFIAVTLIIACNAYSQGLSTGSQVPEITFTNLFNYEKPTAKLSDFRDKLLILDFWSTTCGSCIAAFPKMDSLQQQFRGRLQVLLVNSLGDYDNQTRIARFYDVWKKRHGHSLGLPTLVGDTVLKKHFLHRTIPHYVWVDGNGVVKATTAANQVTAANIQAMLEGREISLRQKKDQMDFDRNKPLFLDNNGGNGANIKYRSVIAGYLDGGIGSGGSLGWYKEDSLIRITFTNQPILHLYQSAYEFHGPSNRIILEIKDSSKIKPGDYDDFDEWIYRNGYCYEVMGPPAPRAELLQRMQHDLQEYFGYTAAIESRIRKCLVLLRNQAALTCLSKNGEPATNLGDDDTTEAKFLRNWPVSTLLEALDRWVPTPVLDESNFSGKVDMKLPSDITGIPALQKALQKYGFDLQVKDREVKCFVLKKIKQ